MTYFVSDVHGEYELFLKLLESINFCEDDTLIVLGDFIDKGNGSIRLARYLFSLPNVIVLCGNHEYDFLKFYHAKLREKLSDNQLLMQLRGYFPTDGALLDWDVIEKLDSLPYYYETDDYICVHAGVPTDLKGELLPLRVAKPVQLVYDRNFKSAPYSHSYVKCVIYGHTPTRYLCNEDKIIAYRRNNDNARPTIKDFYKIHIDTGVSLSGVLGCFCLDTCTCHYATKR